MHDPLHNLNDLMAELEGSALETSKGRYVKVEDVRRLLERRQAAQEEEQEPTPKTMVQAREQAKRFLKKEGLGQEGLAAGKAIPATEPQPVSRP